MCGILGIYTENSIDVKALSYYGMLGLQHRGQEACGLVFHSDDSSNYKHNNTSELFKVEGSVERLFRHVNITQGSSSTCVLGHTRYSTTGEQDYNNIQPFRISNVLGCISLVHNGNLTNTEELKNLCIKYKLDIKGSTDSELILLLISHYWTVKCSLENSILKVVALCKGAFSLIISSYNTMYIYRDVKGVRPLVYGLYTEENMEAHIVTSETCVLDTMGAKYIKEIPIGTLISFSKNNKFNIIDQKFNINKKTCIFENIYFSRPDSIVNEEALYQYRFRLGMLLATKLPVKADVVIGTPDSGLVGALGYSQASSIPYGDGLIKNRYIGRTFIQPTQTMRKQGIKIKLNPIPYILKDKIVVLVDDSIVRGNTSKLIVRSIKEAGATEVHVRISSPPIFNPCNLGMDFPTSEELITYNKSIEDICNYIEADSLAYLSVEDILTATLDNVNNYCTGCFNGQYLD